METCDTMWTINKESQTITMKMCVERVIPTVIEFNITNLTVPSLQNETLNKTKKVTVTNNILNQPNITQYFTFPNISITNITVNDTIESSIEIVDPSPSSSSSEEVLYNPSPSPSSIKEVTYIPSISPSSSEKHTYNPSPSSSSIEETSYNPSPSSSSSEEVTYIPSLSPSSSEKHTHNPSPSSSYSEKHTHIPSPSSSSSEKHTYNPSPSPSSSEKEPYNPSPQVVIITEAIVPSPSSIKPTYIRGTSNISPSMFNSTNLYNNTLYNSTLPNIITNDNATAVAITVIVVGILLSFGLTWCLYKRKTKHNKIHDCTPLTSHYRQKKKPKPIETSKESAPTPSAPKLIDTTKPNMNRPRDYLLETMSNVSTPKTDPHPPKEAPQDPDNDDKTTSE